MDILLPQLQAFLRDNVNFVRDSDICLIPNPGVIPDSAGLPMIGIKDGNVPLDELIGGALGKVLPVEIYLYDRLGRSETSLLGLHQKSRQVSELLREKENRFSGYIISARPISEVAVALLGTKKGLVIRKGLKFEYEREE